LRKHSLLALLPLVFLLGLSNTCFAASEAEAASAIAATREKVAWCYQAVSEADRAGANVTGLLFTLNEAGLLLSKADLAYRMGDYDPAERYATLGLNRLIGFESEARNLRDFGLWQRDSDFWVNIVGSSVGAVVVLVCSFLVWGFLKRKHTKDGAVVV